MTDSIEMSQRLQALSLASLPVTVRKLWPQASRHKQQHRASFDEGTMMLTRQKTLIDLQPRRANSYRMNGLDRIHRSRGWAPGSTASNARHHVHSVDSTRQNSLQYNGSPLQQQPQSQVQQQLHDNHEPLSARTYRTCPRAQFYRQPSLQHHYFQQHLPQHSQPQHQQHQLIQQQQQQQQQQHQYQQSPRRVLDALSTPPTHPRSEMIRRSSGIALMARGWKSDESVERPHMKKTVAVDVPSSSTGLLRQFFVSENVVAPADSSNSRKFTLLTISPKQRRALKASYAALKSGGSWLKLFEQIFRRLESKCPEIRSIFLTTAFVNSLSRERDTPPLVKTEHDHCKCLVMIMEDLIYSEDLDEAISTIRLYGEKHAQMRESGFTPQMIEQFGEIAVSVIVAQDIIKYNHEAVKAWRLFLACVTDEMRVGYEKHSKMTERRNSKAQ